MKRKATQTSRKPKLALCALLATLALIVSLVPLTASANDGDTSFDEGSSLLADTTEAPDTGGDGDSTDAPDPNDRDEQPGENGEDENEEDAEGEESEDNEDEDAIDVEDADSEEEDEEQNASVTTRSASTSVQASAFGISPTAIEIDPADLDEDIRDVDDLAKFQAAFTSGSAGDTVLIELSGDFALDAQYTVDNDRHIVIMSKDGQGPHTLTSAAGVRHFLVERGSTLTLGDVILHGNDAGGGLALGGNLYMEKAEITHCAPSSSGGAMYAYSTSGDISIKNSKLTHNTSSGSGGALYISSSASCLIEDTEISFNKTTNGSNSTAGGGLYFLDGKATLRRCTITDNTSTNGAGVSGGGGTVIEDSEISHNVASSNGGGVYVSAGTFTLRNVTLDDNKAHSGGGLFVTNTMSAVAELYDGCKITNNNAQAGGGVLFYNSGSYLEAGTEISGNTATQSGGGIFAARSTDFTGVIITDNVAGTKGGGVYVENYGTTNYSLTAIDSQILRNTAQEGGGIYHAGVNSDYWGVTVSGGKLAGNTAENGGGIYAVSRGNVTISGDAEVSDNHATAGDGGAMYLDGKFTVGIKDSAVLTGNTAEDGKGGGVALYGQAALTMQDDAEISHSSALNGGGVYVDTDASFTLTGGEVIHNSVATDINRTGGGVHVLGSFTQQGGAISHNTASDGGGVYALNDAVVLLQGGEISHNNAQHAGAGVAFITDTAGIGSFTMEDGSISNNVSAEGGGGLVMHAPGGNNRISGGTISGNTAQLAAGGVWLEYTLLTINGDAIISGNTAAVIGGGIFAAESELILDGDVTISDNEATMGGGIATGVSELTLDGDAIISGNKASVGGGVLLLVSVSDSNLDNVFTINNGTIRDNHALGGGDFEFVHIMEAYAGQGGGIAIASEFDINNPDTDPNNVLVTINGGTFSGNTAAAGAYAMADGDPLIGLHEQNVDTSPTGLQGLSLPFALNHKQANMRYAYNNYDISYVGGTLLNMMPTATFNANGGAPASTSKTVAAGGLLGNAPTVTRTGHTLLGWQKPGSSDYWVFSGTNADTMPYNDITLTAAWRVNTYNVVFHHNDGSSGATPGTATAYGAKVKAPSANPTRPGHSFAGWYTEATGGSQWSFTSGTMPANDLHLYAHWTADAPSNTDSSNEGSASSDDNVSTSPGEEGGGTGEVPDTSSTVSPGSTASRPTPSSGASSAATSRAATSRAAESRSASLASSQDDSSTSTAAPVLNSDGDGGSPSDGPTVNEDGSVTFTAPDGSEITLPAGTYTILENGAVIDHNPDSPNYVQDNGTVDLFGNEVPLGGLVSRGGFGLINLILAILALAGGLYQLLRGLLGKDLRTLRRMLAAASGVLPLLFFLVLENKSQLILFSRFTPLFAVLFVLHLALFITAAVRGRKRAGNERKDSTLTSSAN